MTPSAIEDVALHRHVDAPFEAVEAKVRDLLKSEGFGVITEIDVQKTFKEKIGADFRRYVILGACNPVLAHRAVEADERAGVLLPCNVVVSEAPAGGVEVYMLNPQALLGMAGLPALADLGADARARLDRVLAAL